MTREKGPDQGRPRRHGSRPRGGQNVGGGVSSSGQSPAQAKVGTGGGREHRQQGRIPKGRPTSGGVRGSSGGGRKGGGAPKTSRGARS